MSDIVVAADELARAARGVLRDIPALDLALALQNYDEARSTGDGGHPSSGPWRAEEACASEPAGTAPETAGTFDRERQKADDYKDAQRGPGWHL